MVVKPPIRDRLASGESAKVQRYPLPGICLFSRFSLEGKCSVFATIIAYQKYDSRENDLCGKRCCNINNNANLARILSLLPFSLELHNNIIGKSLKITVISATLTTSFCQRPTLCLSRLTKLKTLLSLSTASDSAGMCGKRVTIG